MKLLKPLLFFASIFTIGTLHAQDIHNTLFNMSPLTMNPALTGAFPGTARIGGIYRNQGFSIGDFREYTTPSFYIDAPIIRGFGKNDWVGVGFMFFSDNVGALNLETSGALLSGAYHLGLGKTGKSVLTLGVQYGSVSRKLDLGRALPGDVLEENIDAMTGGSTMDGTLSGGTGGSGSGTATELDKNYRDISAGLMLRTPFNDETNFEIGISAMHVNSPKYAFKSTESEGGKKPMKIIGHSRLEMMLDEKWSLAPTLLYQTTAKQSEFDLQGWMGYQLNPDFKLNFGLGYRFGDAANVLVGFDYKDLRAALSYDVTLSSLNEVNNYSGSFEIAAYYILKIYKQPNVKPAILCPRF